MAAAQVTWAKTIGPRPDVVALGGTVKSLFRKRDWRLSARDAIAMIEQDEWRFFVEIDDEPVWLAVERTSKSGKRLGLLCDREAGPIFDGLPYERPH